MNPDDYDEDGNNTVPCPICLNVYCPSNDFDQQGNNRNPNGKCPKEDEFIKSLTPHR